MQRVIDIPDTLYTKIQNGKADKRTLETVILHGTPLPKGHGRLIDADKAEEVMMYRMNGTGYQSMAMRVVSSDVYTPTIIEADKE